MIIIGEKINGSIPSVGEAIARRDAEFIKNFTIRQSECHSDFLYISASVSSDMEEETLAWLIACAQEVSEVPLCMDNSDPEMIRKVFPLVNKASMINSVSDEGEKCEILFPLLKDNDWQIMALTYNDKGILSGNEEKVEIVVKLIEKAATYGIAPERIFIDPLVMSLSTVNEAMLNFMETVKEIKRRYPTVKITSDLSNISYGMPYRKQINMNFLAFAISAGMDSAIMEPTNRDMYASILSTEALLGKDRFCRNYIKAFRKGENGPVKD